MKYPDLFQLSTRMFKARTGRTALTILGMGIGIGVILFLVALGYGLQKVLLEAITTSDTLLTLDVLPNPENGLNITSAAAEKIRNDTGVVQVVPAYELRAQIKYGEIVSEGSAFVTEPGFARLDGKKITKGKDISGEHPDEIVVSSAFAKVFEQPEEEMMGKVVTFSLSMPEGGSIEGNKAFRIAGFLESEELVFFANRTNFESNLRELDYSRAKIKCADAASLERERDQLSQEGFLVSSLSDTVKEVNRMFTGIKAVLALFGLVALSISAIGMFNTMTVALLERTKEIGVMKAIGASNRDILMMFIVESTAMGFLGGLVGIFIGWLSGSLFNALVNLAAWKMGGKALSLFSYPFWFLLFILAFAVVIGFATGIVPARRASRIDPLDAMRVR